MQRHKIVAWIVLLILSLINFALALPVLVRGIREVRVDVVEVAKDVTTAPRKRRNPSDRWWTNAADRANTPRNLGIRDSDSPNTHSVPMGPGSPSPAHDNLPLSLDSNAPRPEPSLGSTDLDNSHPLPLGSPSPAHNNLPLDIDPNGSPQSSYGSPPPPIHHNWPLDIDLNGSPQPSQEPTDSHDSGSHSTHWSTDDYDSATSGSHSTGSSSHSSSHATGSETSSDVTMSPSAWYEMSVFEFPKSPSQPSSPDLDPPRPHGGLDIDVNRPPLSPGPTDDKPPLAQPSDPGSSKRPYEGPSLDLWQSKRPYRPLDPGPSTWAHPPQDPGPSTWAYPPQDPGPSTRPYLPSDSKPSTSDPGPSTRPYLPSDSKPSTSDPGPSTTFDSSMTISRPAPSPGQLKHESQNILSELLKGKLKRRTSGYRL